MEDMAVYCDEIVVMNKSSVYMQGKTNEIFSNADKLIQVGLDVPQITHLFIRLKQLGVDVSENVFTVEAAKKELLSCLKSKEGSI